MPPPSRRNAQILLVDDEPNNIRILASALESEYTVTFATSGQDALQMACTVPQPDMILLDVLMPDLDGFEVCARLKAERRTADIAVIFVTALDDQVNEEKGLQVGAIDYINKPISPAVVRARVGMQLELRRHRQFLQGLLERRLEDLDTAQREVNDMVRIVRDREARFRAFMDNSPHALSLKATDGRYLMVNAKFAELAGRAAADIIGMTDSELAMWTDPQSREAAGGHDREVLESGTALTRERSGTTRSGAERCFLVTVFPVLDDDATVVALGTINVDVTEAVESRRQANTLRNAIDQASDAVALYDRNQRVIFTNEEYHRCFAHLPPKEAIIGVALETLLRADLAVGFHENVLARTDPDRYIQAIINRPIGDGINAREVTYGDGRTYLVRERRSAQDEILVVFTDITQRKEAERQLELHQAERRRLASEVSLAEERERRRIAENLHDGPVQDLGLTRVKLGSLRASFSDARVLGQLGSICELLDQSIHNVRSLMSDLSPPILYELGLEAALEWLAKRFQTSHEIDCRVLWSGHAQPIPTEISVSMFRAVRELLVNVAKHARASSVTIDACHEADQLRIAVCDDGRGFDPHATRMGFSDSGGFGLFSVHERLGLLGGHMDVESEGGACVTLFVPLTAPGPSG